MKLFLIILFTSISASYADLREEGRKFLEKTKVHYLDIDRDFNKKHPYRFLNHRDESTVSAELSSEVAERPHCLVYTSSEQVLERLRKDLSVEALSFRREGKKVLFFEDQADSWYGETPVIICENVADHDPTGLLTKLYPTNVKHVAVLNDKTINIRTLHTMNPTLCITEDHKNIEINKLATVLKAFGSLGLKDKVYFDAGWTKEGVGTILSINKETALIKPDRTGAVREIKLTDLLKVEPARGFKFKEEVHVRSDKGSFNGTVRGQLFHNGEMKILIEKVVASSKQDAFELVPAAKVSKIRK